MQYALEIRDAVKRYERFTLDHVTLRVPRGTIMGLIGENGAGKTTLIRLLLGMARPDAGEFSLLDAQGEAALSAAKARVGVVLDEGFFPEHFTAAQVARCCRALYPGWDGEAFGRWLTRFSLPARQKLRALSRGMKTKLSLAVALSHGAELLVLDEATSGLDPVVRAEVLDIFQDYMQDERHAILFSTHITTDLARVADEITFLHRGQVVLQQSKDEILSRYGVLKCSREAFAALSREEVAGAREGAFGCEARVRDRASYLRRHPDAVIDPATLDDVMLFTIKGIQRRAAQ